MFNFALSKLRDFLEKIPQLRRSQNSLATDFLESSQNVWFYFNCKTHNCAEIPKSILRDFLKKIPQYKANESERTPGINL
ncbi:MAG: hypothetical protein C0469_02690 [Cyanobacteria bacterium DS2.3.42]|nr:hypothetical protein [Cyanobacteria bacterium DS2.3.42]